MVLLHTSLWRHNGHNGVSNHQPHHCLLNCLFGWRSKKTSKLRVTGLCAGEFPHKWPVTRKMFPFDDVIMNLWASGCRLALRLFIIHYALSVTNTEQHGHGSVHTVIDHIIKQGSGKYGRHFQLLFFWNESFIFSLKFRLSLLLVA